MAELGINRAAAAAERLEPATAHIFPAELGRLAAPRLELFLEEEPKPLELDLRFVRLAIVLKKMSAELISLMLRKNFP